MRAADDGRPLRRRAGAIVRVTRRSGEAMLETAAEGPLVLVRLPAGSHRVEATLSGHTISKDVSVAPRGSAHAVLAFAGE